VRITRCAVVTAILSAIFLAGCGETEPPAKVDLTTKAQPVDGKDMLGGQMKAANLKGEPTGKTK
jgi:hypothetical protein